MLWLKRVLLILVFLLVALATMDFMLENQQSISLQFLEMHSPSMLFFRSSSAVCWAFSLAG